MGGLFRADYEHLDVPVPLLFTPVPVFTTEV